MKYVGYFFTGVFILIALSIIGTSLKMCGTADKMIDNGINTAYKEFKPEELLRKYEWFKDASSQCEAKRANLKSYETRFNNMRAGYGEDSLKRSKWNRADLEQWNVWESEYLGIKASYNDLAAQYNAAMVKFNYGFCNAGDLPKGATEPLPREFKPYIAD